jgi:hypothetical protein
VPGNDRATSVKARGSLIYFTSSTIDGASRSGRVVNLDANGAPLNSTSLDI